MEGRLESPSEKRQSKTERLEITDCRGKCQKRLNFFEYLPEEILNDSVLSIRLLSVVICRNCEMRTFCLPNYALTRNSISKIMVIWRNRNIYAKIAYSAIVKEEKEPIQKMV